MRIFGFLFLSLCSFFSYASDSALSITLVKNSVILSFPQATRLDSALLESLNYSNIYAYPLGLILSDDEKKNTVIQQQEKLSQQLSKLGEYSPFLSWTESTYQLNSSLLINQLAQLSFVSRLFIPLDIDEIRIKKENNPLLSGQFSLFVPERPTTITVLGLTLSPKPQTLSYIENGSVKDYLHNVDVSSQANTSQVYVIQPDGVVQIASNNQWQKNTVSIAPGATIFIGFNELPDSLSSIHQDIIQLLRNKVN
ncbi:hypothetical protein EIJ81_02825 [Aliivibrio salmonicida]|nr:capsule biosynthesis GfcC family protein [Aliivibrio salmonicida]AZL83736.1 hypothetical protein EIJ81_02825 [Aliivibrio salmonicida]